ncbi:MAG: hypothetical protein J0L92_08570 [Deltaproteobacteria bacterium]|nr:hypothetical protein [Deltaproteobacteria bacterium]
MMFIGRSATVVVLFVGVVLVVGLGLSLARAQPSDLTSLYGSLPTEVGPGATEVSATPADLQRRARIVARVGDVVVRIGEVEDYLLTATAAERAAFSTPQGRRGVVDRLLRFHLLAAESRARPPDPALEWAADRAERRALVASLERAVRRDVAPVPATPPVAIPEERFAVVFYGDTRETVTRWVADHRTASYHDALAHAEALGTAVQTAYGRREQQGEGVQIEAALWRELFRIPPPSGFSAPVRVGARWAAVMLAGLTGGYLDEGPDEEARRMLAADRAWTELSQQVRSDRITGFDPSGLEGVVFRLPHQSPEDQLRMRRVAEASSQEVP